MKKNYVLALCCLAVFGCSDTSGLDGKSNSVEVVVSSFDSVPKCSDLKVISLLDKDFDLMRRFFFDIRETVPSDFQTTHIRKYKNFTTVDVNSAKTMRKCQVKSVYFIKRTKELKLLNGVDKNRISKYPSLGKVGNEIEIDLSKLGSKDEKRRDKKTPFGTFTILLSDDGDIQLSDISLLTKGSEEYAHRAIKRGALK